MFLDKKKKTLLLLSSLALVAAVSFRYGKAAYLATNRDTKLPPDKVTYDIAKLDEFEKLHETDTLVYYYREDRDVFVIEDKRNGYTWKTGLDIPFGQDITQAVMDAKTQEEKDAIAVPVDDKMGTSYTGIANSILTVEYNENGTVKNMSSASKEMVESKLVTLNDNPATRRLDVDFQNIEVEVKVYITLGEDSIRYEIKNEDISGKGIGNVMALVITPFLGASGGRLKHYNPETDMYDILEDKYMIPGYAFVPDGSGSLIRFQNNSASFTMYYGDVYGADPAQHTYYNNGLTDAIPLKDPVMPVFGVAHGNQQAAFVAYADSGAEYMQIAVRPEENMTAYTYVYPRFIYNVDYHQVFNKRGDGYFTLMKEPNQFDIDITYSFLSGDGSDGSFAADYTGMALAYRSHLIDQGILRENKVSGTDIPLRLDFIMSDVKKGIVGMDEVVVTNVSDVRQILTDVTEKLGIYNISSGLYGWQQGGETLARPDSANYYRKIGSKKDFQALFTDFAEQNIDISYARDYTFINPEMMNYLGTAVRHVNSWYLELDKSSVVPFNSPVYMYSYAKPEKSAAWFQKQLDRAKSYSQSMTIGGMSGILLSNYDSEGVVSTVSDTIALYQKVFEEANQKVKLNFEAPNMYLWKYTDRFLQSPVGTSQYVFETDAVPFLQLVLNGTMEVYAPYANFSFYTQTDILRMIDYNLSPSFILSKEPSHYLSSTPSSDLYSTEYNQYEELINGVYSQINEVLGQVSGYDWIDREVWENGVIINTYRKDKSMRKVIVNYTEDSITVEETSIAPLSALVVEAGEVQ